MDQAIGSALYLRNYHRPQLAGVPVTEVHFADTFDTHPLGAKSMSESPYNPVGTRAGHRHRRLIARHPRAGVIGSSRSRAPQARAAPTPVAGIRLTIDPALPECFGPRRLYAGPDAAFEAARLRAVSPR